MRTAHEAVPDETDVEIVFCHVLYRCALSRLHYFRLRPFGLALRAQPLMPNSNREHLERQSWC
jgi:hypothetical protein